MFGKYILQFKDIEGNPLIFRKVTAINYSNIFSSSEIGLTNTEGIAVVWFFSLANKIRIQPYFGFHRLPVTYAKRDKRLVITIPKEYIEN